jgi:hypothetical protein
VLNAWLRFWFEPTPPTRLGLSRLLFFSGLFLFSAREDFSAWGDVSRAFWMPLPLFVTLHLTPLSSGALQAVQDVWLAALLLSAAGVYSRVSMTVAAVLGFYLLGLPHNFGHTFHFDAALVITSVILACSRAGDAWSVDAALARGGQAAGATSGEYTWPIRMIWVATALVFFAAGVAKLRYGGIAWVTSDNMRILLLRASYHVSDADPWTRAGLWIAAHAWISRALAATALAIELGFALSLVSRWARAIFVPAAFGLLIGIRALMGPTFGGFLIVYVFWVPWDRLLARAAAWLARPATLPVVAARYDVAAEDAERQARVGAATHL